MAINRNAHKNETIFFLSLYSQTGMNTEYFMLQIKTLKNAEQFGWNVEKIMKNDLQPQANHFE